MTNFNKVAKNKTTEIKNLIHSALRILQTMGVPMDELTPRRLEKMAMVFLAVCDVKSEEDWKNAPSKVNSHTPRSREIIRYLNANFEESISEGSYDDIRRKDLYIPALMGIVVKSANKPGADTNDGTRGFGLSEHAATLIAAYNTDEWQAAVDEFHVDSDFLEKFNADREIKKIDVILPDGFSVSLDAGPHNEIQAAIVNQFLPNFGYGAEVLYIGDTSSKNIYKNTDKLAEIGLNSEERGMLPDIVAFSNEKKWVYIIEAVHSSNPLNPERCIELQRTVLKDCPYGVVFVTAFLTRKDFAKWCDQIAWETEVWLASNPEHMIHFNGDKFFGPHKENIEEA